MARLAGGLGYGLAAAIGLDGGSQLSLRGERKGLAIALAMTGPRRRGEMHCGRCLFKRGQAPFPLLFPAAGAKLWRG